MSEKDVLLCKKHPNGTRTWGPCEYDSKNYYLIRDPEKGIAICDENGKMISEWFDSITLHANLYQKKSKCFIAEKNKKQAIFRIDGKRISDWFYDVYSFGVVEGTSPYYIACKEPKTKKDGYGYIAIFHVDNGQLTKWYRGWTSVLKPGFVSGEKSPCVFRLLDCDVVLALDQTKEKEKIVEAIKVSGKTRALFTDFYDSLFVTTLKNDSMVVKLSYFLQDGTKNEKCYLINPPFPLEVTISPEVKETEDVVKVVEESLAKRGTLIPKFDERLIKEKLRKRPKL